MKFFYFLFLKLKNWTPKVFFATQLQVCPQGWWGCDDSGAVMTVTGQKKKQQPRNNKRRKMSPLRKFFSAASQVVKSDDTTRGWRGDSADGRAAVKGASSKTKLFTGTASLFVGVLRFFPSLSLSEKNTNFMNNFEYFVII